jgi:hypothetical protein
MCRWARIEHLGMCGQEVSRLGLKTPIYVTLILGLHLRMKCIIRRSSVGWHVYVLFQINVWRLDVIIRGRTYSNIRNQIYLYTLSLLFPNPDLKHASLILAVPH